jgi:hypothetical protein
MSTTDFEKLGVFYLGRAYDLPARQRLDQLVLYDAKDLVTHAVCVGMTGSGKTGLCLALLEEALLDGVPAIVIDPKGDLANLLLTFPDLAPADFRPWINEDDARRKGVEPDIFAQQQADLWKRGLAEWGQDGERIARLKSAAEFAIYTPGSNAGLPVSVLKSFDAPGEDLTEDTELFRERITSTVTSLLGLLGVDADPLQSREHILLSTIFSDAWSKGEGLDLASIIQRIQQPPVSRIGVMEVETFFPAKDRFALAMSVNNLVASPGFSRWTEGAALDVGTLLYTPAGKPRVAIFSIAHLSDAERMFFVSLLLNQTLAWVRTQSGTTSLRALLYMDEIAGYFPPVANPPSKQPLLTLMKQARAFGFGVVLATQNPVDLDYKGLANAGTWFIGRLQTERDKARVLDGLEGAAAGAGAAFDRAGIDAALSALGSRVFLMNNVHDDRPVVFETRWVMSYLRGPLTRGQIKTLVEVREAPPGSAPVSAPVRAERPGGSAAVPGDALPDGIAVAGRGPAQRPVLPPEIPQYFLPVRSGSGGGSVEYRPMLLGSAKVHFSDAKLGVETDEIALRLALIADGPVVVDWDAADPTDLTEDDIEREPAPSASFIALPSDAGKAKSYDAWRKAYADSIFRTFKLELLSCAELGAVSSKGENERAFRVRLQQVVREQRDAAAEKLRQKYASKFATLNERLRKAQQAVEVQKEQASQSKVQTAISFGSAVLGAFLGRKAASAGTMGRAATAARGVGRSMKESSDIGRAQENVDAVREQIGALEAQFKEDVEAAAPAVDPLTTELERLAIKPKKAGIAVRAVVLVWAPHVNGTPVWC